MPQRDLDGFRVAILVDTDFEQVELTEPKKALDDAGATTRIVSPRPGPITGMKHDEKKDQFKVDLNLEQASPDDFDAVMLPGGALNADTLRMNERARDFVRRMDQAGKPLAVICHAPWLLIDSGVLDSHRVTSYPSLQSDLRNAGATWVDQEVVVDRGLITSRSPKDIPAFTRAFIAEIMKANHLTEVEA